MAGYVTTRLNKKYGSYRYILIAGYSSMTRNQAIFFFFFFFFYIPLKIYKTNYLLQYLLITLRNTTRTIIPRGAVDYDNPVAINIERNKNYRVNQERCTTRPQSRTQEPPTDSHNSLRI